eukprot:Rmarinus@m.244
MAEELCKWVDRTVQLSQKVQSPDRIASFFCNGFYFGELLVKLKLLDSLDGFVKDDHVDSKIRNFLLLEPVFLRMQFKFASSVFINSIMREDSKAAAKLLFEIMQFHNNFKKNVVGNNPYLTVGQKKTNNILGVQLVPKEINRKHEIDTQMFERRLRELAPNPNKLREMAHVQKFYDRGVEHERRIDEARCEALAETQMQRAAHREERRDRLKENMSFMRTWEAEGKKTHSKNLKRMREMEKSALTVELTYQEQMTRKKRERNERASKEATSGIDSFEKTLKKYGIDSESKVVPDAAEAIEEMARQERIRGLTPLEHLQELQQCLPNMNEWKDESSAYLSRVKLKQLEEKASRMQRERRRRQVLIEQRKTQRAMEEKRRQELLLQKLLKDSNDEKRIAERVASERQEKEIIKRNREHREKQYLERRQADLEDRKRRNAEMGRRQLEEYKDKARLIREQYDNSMAAMQEAARAKRTDMCRGIVMEIVDLSIRVGDYRNFTDTLVPPKEWREWLGLFFKGFPLAPERPDTAVVSTEDEAAAKIIDEDAFRCYIEALGEWGQDATVEDPDAVLGKIIHRLDRLVHPPDVPPPPPVFPPYPLKIALLGKPFAGKTTVARALVEEFNLVWVSPDELVQAAVKAVQEEEDGTAAAEAAAAASGKKGKSSPALRKDTLSHSTDLVRLGMTAKAAMEKGKEVDDETIVALVVLKIRSIEEDAKKDIPEDDEDEDVGSSVFSEDGLDEARVAEAAIADAQANRPPRGWILDGFPQTVAQAKQLEAALTGFDPKTMEPAKDKPNRKLLAPSPPQDAPARPISGIDLVIRIDLTNGLVLERAAGRRVDPVTGKEYHVELDPPPDDEFVQERLMPVNDPSYDETQLQHRLHAYEREERGLEKWFSVFGTMRHVCVDEEFLQIAFERAQQAEAEAAATAAAAAEVDTTAGSQAASRPGSRVAPGGKDPSTRASGAEAAVSPQPSQGALSEAGGDCVVDLTSECERLLRRLWEKKEEAEEKKRLEEERLKLEEERNKLESGGGVSVVASTDDMQGQSARSRAASSAAVEATATATPVAGDEDDAPPGPPDLEDLDIPPFTPKDVDLELAELLLDQWNRVETDFSAGLKGVFRRIRIERREVVEHIKKLRMDYIEFLRRPDRKQELVDRFVEDFNSFPMEFRKDSDCQAELCLRSDELRDELWAICDDRKEENEKERKEVINDGWAIHRQELYLEHFKALVQWEVDRYQMTRQIILDYFAALAGEPLGEAPETLPDVRPSKASGTTAPAGGKKPPTRGAGGAGDNTQILEAAVEAILGADYDESKDVLPSLASLFRTAVKVLRSPSIPSPPEKTDSKTPANATGKAGAGKKGAEPEPEPEPEEIDIEKMVEEESARRAFEEALECENSILIGRLARLRKRCLYYVSELRYLETSLHDKLEEWLGTRFKCEVGAVSSLASVIKQHVNSQQPIRATLLLSGDDFIIDEHVITLPEEQAPPPPPAAEQPYHSSFMSAQVAQLLRRLQRAAPDGIIRTQRLATLISRMAYLSPQSVPPDWQEAVDKDVATTIATAFDFPQHDVVYWPKMVLSVSLLPHQPSFLPDVKAALKLKEAMEDADGDCDGKLTADEFMTCVELIGQPDPPVFNEATGQPTTPFPRRLRIVETLMSMAGRRIDGKGPFIDILDALLLLVSDVDPAKGVQKALAVACRKDGSLSTKAVYQLLHYGRSPEYVEHPFGVSPDPYSKPVIEQMFAEIAGGTSSFTLPLATLQQAQPFAELFAEDSPCYSNFQIFGRTLAEMREAVNARAAALEPEEANASTAEEGEAGVEGEVAADGAATNGNDVVSPGVAA